MASHFIVYAARRGARNFFEGISDPTFFMTINKILDDGHYKEYKDPRHGEIFQFESLHDFVTHREGLGIPDWVPFMKALQAQDEGSKAKALYWRMLETDKTLDPLSGVATAAQPLARHGEIGNGRADEGRDYNINSTGQAAGTSQTYLLRRLARDAPEILERVKTGEFKSARAAAIEAGIIKDIPSIQLKEPAPTAQKLLAKKGQAWCLQLMEELSELTFEDPAGPV